MENDPRQGTITIREYARRRNCSDTAIHKAITSGKITKGLVKIDGVKWSRINPDIADQEWVQNFNAIKSQNPKMAAKIFEITTKEPDIIPIPSIKEPVTVQTPQEPPEKDTTLVQAQRARAVYEAKMKELEYKRMLGTLVDQAKVYRNLFTFGQEIRSALQALPDRIIDDILAASSRNAAHALLYNATSDILERLSHHPELSKE